MDTPRYIDAHSHLNFSQFDDDRDVLIDAMAQEGIWTITVGTSVHTSQEAVALARTHEHLFATVGIHPTEEEENVSDISNISDLAGSPGVVGIGECGLDYYRIDPDDVQIKKHQK